MKSSFSKLTLNNIRYSLVWESPDVVAKALEIEPEDEVLIISSAGCNVLNAVLENPKSITAIDINPYQNKLLGFKMKAIRHGEYQHFAGILGLLGKEKVQTSFDAIKPHLSQDEIDFWTDYLIAHPKGLLLGGKLEQYLINFVNQLPEDTIVKVKALCCAQSMEDQRERFKELLETTTFEERFLKYFSQVNLSRGRDFSLYDHAESTGEQSFLNRLSHFVNKHKVADSFQFQYFFFGLSPETLKALPPCYREENFERLQNGLDKITCVDGEAIEYLTSEKGHGITKASLSNIFEYVSKGEFYNVVFTELASRTQSLKVIFWNLLNGQGESSEFDAVKSTNSDHRISGLQELEKCFFFKSIQLLSI